MNVKIICFILSALIAVVCSHKNGHSKGLELVEYQKICDRLRIRKQTLCYDTNEIVHNNKCQDSKTANPQCFTVDCNFKPTSGKFETPEETREVTIAQLDYCPQVIKAISCSYPNKHCTSTEYLGRTGCCKVTKSDSIKELWYFDEDKQKYYLEKLTVKLPNGCLCEVGHHLSKQV